MRWYVLALAACSSGSSTPQQQPPPPPPADARPPAFDAAEHEDTHGSVFPRIPTRAPKPIDIVLYSSPIRATVAVDGRVLGRTPNFWAGEADGLEHEFVFSEPGYADARYRFVPITGGTVHAKLEQLSEGARDAAPASPAPSFTPDAAPPPPIDAPPRVESRPPPRPDAAEVSIDAPEAPATDAPRGGPEP